VQGIVKSHEGAISVYSQLGKGTQFRMLFPAVDARPDKGEMAAPAPSRGRGERILYLDDEASLVMLAQRMLGRLGYEVLGFTNAENAIAAFAQAPDRFDLVLTDMSMPGIDGIEVARRLLAIRADMPILLASGYVRPEDVERAKAAGIREVIWKPATFNEMADVVHALFSKARNSL
jgi:CheY-like chemotaxis protein